MLAGLGHSKSVLYKGDYLVPRKVLYLGPIGTECLRTHVERLACIQFDSSMVHCARLCTIAIPNVARSILIHAACSEIWEGTVQNDRELSGRVVGFVNGRLALFFRSCLMPRGENEIIMLRGVQVCRWAIVRVECILQVPEHTFLSENRSNLTANEI